MKTFRIYVYGTAFVSGYVDVQADTEQEAADSYSNHDIEWDFDESQIGNITVSDIEEE